LRISAADAPTDDTLQPPVPAREADQGTTGVALARVLATRLVARTQHVLVDTVVKVTITHRPRYDWNDHLAQDRVDTSV